LWKSLKRSSFPLFVFPAGGNWRLAEAKEGSKRKKLHFGGSRLGGCDILNPIQEAKMEILAKRHGCRTIG
jgi:hypothetical protein